MDPRNDYSSFSNLLASILLLCIAAISFFIFVAFIFWLLQKLFKTLAYLQNKFLYVLQRVVIY